MTAPAAAPLFVLVTGVAAALLWPGGGRPGGLVQGRWYAPARPGSTRSDGNHGGVASTLAGGIAGCSGRGGRSGHRGPVGWRWRARARRVAFDSALADLVAVLAAPMRAGVAPAVAVAAALPTFGDDEALGPLLSELSEATARGAPVAEVWLRHARSQGSHDLSFIGRAWGLSELTGASLAAALACGEEVLRARARGRERLSAAAAGPRASMAVLCLLPASGPVVGAVMGVDPMTLYFASPVATASLALGVGLGLGAWWWSRRILRTAT